MAADLARPPEASLLAGISAATRNTEAQDYQV